MLLRITAKTLRESSLKFKKENWRDPPNYLRYIPWSKRPITRGFFFENRQVVSLKHMMC